MTTLTATTVRALPTSHDDATKAGGYFVSNYPPFHYWGPEHVRDAYAAFDEGPKEGVPLGLYVHIPFCRKRCHFCYYKVYTDKNAAAIQEYLDALIEELRIYSEGAFVGDRKLQTIYFGGGTPSYLSAKQLTYLTEGLKRVLPWDDVEEVTFECEPGTLNEKKVAAIRDMGVTRLSFGIENFSDHVLEANGRAHLSKQVYAAYEWARNVGFPQINVDLIAGMLEETEENWLENVEKTIELDPDCVTIYQMEVPFNTTIYKRMKEAGELTAPVADWDTKRRWVKYAFAELEARGYEVNSVTTVVKDVENTQFLYRDSQWRGSDLIGIGVASFGHINHAHYQNVKDIGPYVETVNEDRLPIHRALRINDEEALVREFVLQLKLGRVERKCFTEKFGVDVADRFGDVLGMYEREGFLTVDSDAIELDRDALLQVDRMLHEFFLPEHRGERLS